MPQKYRHQFPRLPMAFPHAVDPGFPLCMDCHTLHSRNYMDHQAARAFILAELHAGLPRWRTYHSLEHTLDVYASAITIAEEEGIKGDDLVLLKTAALYHDSGFLLDPSDHEAASCRLVQQHLPRFGYTADHVDRICNMILSTKVPQRAMDPLSGVLCDADLDYLGREDFFMVGDRLYHEMRTTGALHNRWEWNRLQEGFLSAHTYYTRSSRLHREPKKQKHLAWIRQWLIDNP